MVDQRLATLLQTDVPQFSRLYESMNYSLLAGGKRLRPVLFLATLEALGKNPAVRPLTWKAKEISLLALKDCSFCTG